jgi:hypothetical protein
MTLGTGPLSLRLTGRVWDDARGRHRLVRLTRADAVMEAGADKGEVAGSIPASPTPPIPGDDGARTAVSQEGVSIR